MITDGSLSAPELFWLPNHPADKSAKSYVCNQEEVKRRRSSECSHWSHRNIPCRSENVETRKRRHKHRTNKPESNSQ